MPEPTPKPNEQIHRDVKGPQIQKQFKGSATEVLKVAPVTKESEQLKTVLEQAKIKISDLFGRRTQRKATLRSKLQDLRE